MVRNGRTMQLPRGSRRARTGNPPSASFIFQPPERVATGERCSSSENPTLLSTCSTCECAGCVASARTQALSIAQQARLSVTFPKCPLGIKLLPKKNAYESRSQAPIANDADTILISMQPEQVKQLQKQGGEHNTGRNNAAAPCRLRSE